MALISGNKTNHYVNYLGSAIDVSTPSLFLMQEKVKQHMVNFKPGPPALGHLGTVFNKLTRIC